MYFTRSIQEHPLTTMRQSAGLTRVNSLQYRLNLSKGLSSVHFHYIFTTPINKKHYIIGHLRKLALAVIYNIPKSAIEFFTDSNILLTI